ncbi:non-ribosomal peptide synthetase [Amycolatopsis umgeniensis]|uniref:Amino acid adenylation domain-containing protein n=1 Tax=Amycolatopsis umgeniensis TaxID=336628 RepID=A0A841BF85_9PSEU|nr:non-ribosomal peptide synthetase [Amycolatopsis umgeniensis]MBB5857455.1 amino acid adenylation domain-containing protein [Amycolatopsis umgeniensis]
MVESGDVHPLSPSQEQLWFIDELRSNAAIEHLLSATLRLRGALDVGALTAALTEISARHAVLRSRFDTVDGAAVQIITDPAPVKLSIVDITGLSPSERETSLRELRLRDLRTPIDLRTEPPWRLTLVRSAGDEAVLLIAVHHIAFDGLSWSVLARELDVFYGSATLPAPALQHHEALRRREQGTTTGGLSYWADRLAGITPLELPTDRARPSKWVADGDCVDLVVPPDLADRLRELGRTHRATPFMVYLAAYQLLLARYSRQDDVAVGVSVSTRRPDELPLIGMFLNTVVLRGDLSGEPSFVELLGQARKTALEAYAHQDVPFDQVIAQLEPERDPSRNPVFQAGIAWYDARRQPYRLPGLDVTLCPPLWASSAFDLSLHLAQFADGSVHGQLIYPTSLFDRIRIERMAANYVRLLEEIAAAPEDPAHSLELAAESEQDRLRSFGTSTTEETGQSLPELFFAQAARSPRSVAVLSDVDELSYGELAARVEALAGHLRQRGVGTETPVGVAMDRGTDLAVALLAILTAGATYVPLPPDHPAERLRHVVADTGITLVLSHAGVDVRLPETLTRIDLDERRDTIPLTEHPAIHGAQIAYVVHTSGSTGTPKGVAVTHGGIRNRVLWSVRHQLTAADRVLQKTTIGFDASMWELLAPFVAGATLVMAPPGAHRDPTAMAASITRHGATVLQLVPSVLRLLLDEPGFAGCTSLRLVCSAGEALPVSLCQRLTALLDVAVDNTYGPTECAIDVTAGRYRRDERAGTVPIGTPLSNTRVFVVDAADRLVPIGVPGELCVSGVGLARGYADRPDQTARQFTPHPYPSIPGERWYRTGDLARWRDDGTLEYAGRVDHQVKINGVRIEPAEIEAALCSHPDVTAAAVVPHRAPAGDTTLVAYAVSANGTTPAELSEHLSTRLPSPMIPPAIHLLDALPLGPNGKLDRAALPTPSSEESTSDDHTAPSTPTERFVAAAMAEMLGVDHVDVRADFFGLGGHSLLAIRLVLKLRREFGGELTVGELFDDRTVERLAARLDAGTTGAAVAAIRPVARDGGLPLSFAQQRMWFLDQLDPGSVEYLIPLALRLSGPLSVDAFQRAVDRLAARHEVLRTRYVDQGGEPVQVVDPPGPVAFRLVDLTGRPTEAHELMDQVSGRPFDLGREHPLRVTVIRVDADEHLVALTLHHIAFDAWSMDILFRDLNAAHDGPLPIQYADFAAWQRSAQSTQDREGQLRYWRDRLAGLTPVELTTDRPRPAQRDPRGDTVAVTVPVPVAKAVTELATRQGATPFMTLLAAFQVLLGRYTGRTDVSVGTPVAGRTRQETEELLGLFTNTLVLRADLDGEPTFIELLDRVRRDCTDAFAHQDVPFEHLVDALQPDRDLSRNPLFQIMFELEHLENRPDTLCGTTVGRIASGAPVAKFDLVVSVQQRDGGELRCVFEYATSLFDRATVERMAGHYLSLLASIGADPDRGLAELDILGEDERRRLLTDWPDPDRGRLAALDPVDEHRMGVSELVERQAALRPGAVAVVSGERQLTYAELNARANRFARLLRARGTGPETVVGVCLERSLDAVVVLLGVLKSGGVYAPFDPRHPAERLDFMLTDAGARMVVTSPEFAGRFGDREVVTVDGDSADWPAEEDNPVPRPDPRALAYLIYTSGSTGRPKGVMIEHRSYAHHCRVIADAYTIGSEDRVVLLSALTFDVAMDQIGATLLTGATIVVSDPESWTPAELPARLAEYGVTIIDTAPAFYREAMRYGPDLLAGLRLMNVGADVVTVDDARQWAATGHPGRFLCSYGPTEATICSLLYPVAGDLDGQQGGAAMPIGRPVAGTRAYIVDADLRPVPTGVPGELCLGGVRLARGYHHRAALTAERFVPDPFGPPGSRLYRTGDLVRYRQDGAIEFLGRIDHQIKIRGLRIELGEIEAALLRHVDVDAAVVVTTAGPSGDPLLAAYVVGEPGADALREHLRALLPEYMVPARWAKLAALPMTTSGKVDRKALPSADLTASDIGPAEAPRDPAEQLITDIWREVLGVDRVGVTDDFFALGGHSLLATRVLAQLRRAFAVELPLRRLFEATTVAELAQAVTQAVEDEITGLSDAEVARLLASEAT